MTIGKVIRKYRKHANLTQEEMAVRLGVTAPAVNKWENENSCPDITLLAPIARLLNISLETLLSFQEDLTEQEIIDFVDQAAQIMKEKSYEEVFRWMKQVLEQYPNCEPLSLNFAAILDAQGIFQGVSEQEKYEKFICGWYERALDSKDENIRTKAADALTNFYLRKKQYDRAEKYLEYLSLQNPEKKRKKAQICAETGRLEEAYKVYEELLFSDYMRASVELQGIYMLALQETDRERAHRIVEKQKELAHCFEMGAYYEDSPGLELATLEQDADAVISIMEKMLSSVEHIGEFRKAPLYEHMEFKETSNEFKTNLKENLLKCFQNEDSYGFLKEDKRWQRLVGQ